MYLHLSLEYKKKGFLETLGQMKKLIHPKKKQYCLKCLKRGPKKLMKKYKLKLQEIPIIIYCYNNTCDASVLLANILFSHGYTNILDYEGGIIDFLGR